MKPIGISLSMMMVLWNWYTPPSIYFWVVFSNSSMISGCSNTAPISIHDQYVWRKNLLLKSRRFNHSVVRIAFSNVFSNNWSFLSHSDFTHLISSYVSIFQQLFVYYTCISIDLLLLHTKGESYPPPKKSVNIIQAKNIFCVFRYFNNWFVYFWFFPSFSMTIPKTFPIMSVI